jgi:methenyltetrahydrofolate cyclohydrolase
MTDATPLVDLSVAHFLDRLATAEPTPGGGSASALGAATAAALVGMVASLSQGRRAGADEIRMARDVESAAAALRAELLELADRDAAAYAGVIAARRLPRETPDEGAVRQQQLAQAMADATAVPLHTAERIAEVLELAERLAPGANRNAISDLGVAAHLGAAALDGALLNIRTNLPYLPAAEPLRTEAAAAVSRLAPLADARRTAILAIVDRRMSEAEEAAR